MSRTWPELPTGYVSVQEARGRLGIAQDTIYRWMNSGRLPSRRLGDRRIIPAEAVERLAATLKKAS